MSSHHCNILIKTLDYQSLLRRYLFFLDFQQLEKQGNKTKRKIKADILFVTSRSHIREKQSHGLVQTDLPIQSQASYRSTVQCDLSEVLFSLNSCLLRVTGTELSQLCLLSYSFKNLQIIYFSCVGVKRDTDCGRGVYFLIKTRNQGDFVYG